MQIISKPVDILIPHLTKRLVHTITHQDDPLTLVLSGGSWAKVYQALTPLLSGHDLSHITLILGDERYTNPQGPDSNESLIRSTGLIDVVTSRGGVFVPFVRSIDMSAHVIEVEIDTRYRDILEKSRRVIATLGVGADGHTAGMLPASPELFNQRFSGERLVRYFEMSAVETKNPHLKRFTTTPAFFAHIDQVYVFAVGHDKSIALGNITSPTGDVAHTPGRLIRDISRTTIYTDRDESSLVQDRKE